MNAWVALGLNFKHQIKTQLVFHAPFSSLFPNRRNLMRDSSYLQLRSWKVSLTLHNPNRHDEVTNEKQKVPVYIISSELFLFGLKLGWRCEFLCTTVVWILIPGVLEQVPHQEQKHHDMSYWHKLHWIFEIHEPVKPSSPHSDSA